jgi:hypothetical protein
LPLIILLLLITALPALAQTEEWAPFTLQPYQTEIHIWTSAEGLTYARVKLTFNNTGHRIVDWGEVVRNGNDFSVDIKPERWTGVSGQMILELDQIYELGRLAPGAYTFSVKSRGAAVESQPFDPVAVIEHWEAATPTREQTLIGIRTSGGVTFAFVTLNMGDQPVRVLDWGTVARHETDFSIDIKIERWTGAPVRRGPGVNQAFSLGPTPPGSYSFTVYSRGALVFRQPFNVLSASGSVFGNPIDDPHFFVRQHYLDFLNREPESGGLTYWTYQLINPCNGLSTCIYSIRHRVSAAFFLSAEFHETGYFVYRFYKASYARRPAYAEFVRDRNLLVAGPNIEASKQAFAENWTNRAEFKEAYPETMTPEEFVNKLFDTMQLFPYTDERLQLAQEMRDGKTRAEVLRAAIEIREFVQREKNPAFVLMQYFGYLRRDPDEGGYLFWLDVVNNRDRNNYNGMVRAFINSAEYRARFSQ